LINNEARNLQDGDEWDVLRDDGLMEVDFSRSVIWGWIGVLAWRCHPTIEAKRDYDMGWGS
jgi:hypothetical protein